MNGPTIQQIKQSNPESLWQFLAALPSSMEAQVLYGFFIFGLLGMVVHYGRQYLAGEIVGSPMKYLFSDYPRRTILAFCGVIAGGLGAIVSNVFVNDQGQFVGWMNVLWVALTHGYACDSLGNRGSKGGNGIGDDLKTIQVQPGGKITSVLVALAVFLALAIETPGARAQSANTTNIPVTLIASGVQNTTPINTADQTNVYWHGVTVVINVSAFTAGTYTPHLQGKDNVSGVYYDMLVGPAIGATGTTVLRVYPGMTPIANQANGDVLPRTWRLQLVGATGQNMTLSVGAILVQ